MEAPFRLATRSSLVPFYQRSCQWDRGGRDQISAVLEGTGREKGEESWDNSFEELAVKRNKEKSEGAGWGSAWEKPEPVRLLGSVLAGARAGPRRKVQAGSTKGSGAALLSESQHLQR